MEEKKPVFTDDSGSVWFALFLHIVPVVSASVIITINLRGLYVGKDLPGTNGENSFANFAFQLAAKVNELLILASLSAIVFQQFRWHLNSEDGLPFGAIAACFQISMISNLWSPELVALLKCRFSTLSYQTMFVATVVFATVLGLIAGPASATALKPFIKDWPAGGTTFWLNATSSSLFPRVLNESSAIDYDCQPTGGTPCVSRYWNAVADGVFSFWPRTSQRHSIRPEMIRSAYIPTQHALRSLSTRFVGPFLYNPGISFATIQPEAVSSAVAQLCSLWFTANTDAIDSRKGTSFKSYNDIICSTRTIQPVVFARCNANDPTLRPDLLKFNPVLHSDRTLDYDNNGVQFEPLFDSLTGNHSHVGLIWTTLQDQKSSQRYLGAIAAVPISAGNERADQLLSCVLDARWVDTTVEVSFSIGPFVVSGEIERLLLDGLFNHGSGVENYPFVDINANWARSVNTVLQQEDATVFERLCTAVGLSNGTSDTQEPLHAIEGILAAMIAQGMGIIGKHSTIQGDLTMLKTRNGWEEQFLPRGQEYGKSGDAFIVNELTRQNYPMLNFVVNVNGYGYGYSASTLFSILTLSAYVLLAVTYLGCSITKNRIASSAWDSVSEIIALALRSEKLEAMRNTGAGITRLVTFTRTVSISVDDDGDDGEELSLQMDDEKRPGRRQRLRRQVELNEWYG